MNQRIKELAEQAGLSHMPSNRPDMADLYEGADFELAKFAELIVNECCERIGPYWEGFKNMPNDSTDDIFAAGAIAAVRTECVAEMKQHFGIEE